MTLKTDQSGISILWRFFWRSVAGLVVFAQIAVAADRCATNPLLGEHQDHAGVVAADVHGLDSPCVSDLVPADQAPAPEAKRSSPDIGGMPAPVVWRSALDGALIPASHPPARAGPSLRLRFRNLRL